MAKTTTERQATWRHKVKTFQEWKAHMLARWAEHNVLHYIRQEDGGIRILLEHTPEGDRITAELAKYSGLNPDTVIQQLVGEVLTENGGVWIPAKRKDR